MSTKISALDERLQSNIDGEEFFPIIDGTPGAYHTYKIKLDSLFASDQGYEKITGLAVTDGATVASNNTQFELTYTKEDNSTDVITIDKYAIQNNDVAFSHIDPAGYITSVDRIDTHIVDDRLTTAKAVDTHIDHREALYDTDIKGYFGDSTTSRVTGNHILKDFRLNAEVASDFIALLDGVNTNLNTFKKIEDRFATIDYSDKIGTSQVNIAHFRINATDLNNRLNIKDSAIGTNLLNSSAVTTVKVKDGAITNSKLSTEAVSAIKIQPNAVTSDKIKGGSVTPTKLSAGAPSWSGSTVSVPGNLAVGSNVVAQSNISSYGTDFKLYSAGRSGGNVHQGRALVHNRGDKLTINYAGDYTGGVEINGVVSVPDQTTNQILASGPRAVVTKEYVDRADIRIRPLDPTRIQDDCIQLRHMSDNSVGTFEILDDSITSAKVENIGPQWTNDGTVTIIKDLDVNGLKLDLGDRTSTSNDPTVLKLISSKVPGTGDIGYARVLRKSGQAGALQIDNKGSTQFTVNNALKLEVSTANVKVDTALHITGKDSTTIGYNNFTNPALLVGASDYGIAIDSNEIVQKGNHLHIGVADPATQNINFQGGSTLLTRIYGSSGTVHTSGGFITDSGVISTNDDTSQLVLRGGSTDKGGANIELYGSNNANHPGYAYYDADKHTFRSKDNTVTALQIDSKSKKVTLFGEGTSNNHLVTKSYVDKNTFPKITLLNDITLRMNSGFYETNAADTSNGWPESTGSWYHLLTSTHSNTSNYNSLQFAAPFYEQDVYFRSTDNDGKKEWNKLWHTNNDGTGSGLDADLLDGKEATAFAPTVHNHDSLYRKLTTKIGISDLTPGAPQWQSNGILQSLGPIFVSDAAPSNGIYTRNVYGRSESGSGIVDKSLRLFGGNAIGASIELFDPSHASAADAIRIKSNSTTGIYANSKLSLEVKDNGHIVAPQQTQAFITSNNKSLTTKEYVTAEIAKVFPDDNYILKTGGDVGGDLSFANLSGKGITWTKNTDNASIKFYNTSDQDANCRLEFQVGDNRDEHFLFTHKTNLGQNISLLKISNSEISYKGDKLMTGIATDQVVSTSIKNNAVTTAKIANGQVTAAKIGTSQVTTAKIGDSQVTEAKLANVAPGFLLGKGHHQSASATNLVQIGTDITNTHDKVPSSQAVREYVDSRVTGLATTSYVDNKVSGLATTSYVNSKLGGGRIHYYTVGTTYTSSSAAISSAALANARAGLSSVVSAGDVVIVKARVTWTDYWWKGNSTGSQTKNDYVIGFYSVASSSVWHKIARGVSIDTDNSVKNSAAYSQLRATS